MYALHHNVTVQRVVAVGPFFMNSLQGIEVEWLFTALSRARNLRFVKLCRCEIDLDFHLVHILLGHAPMLEELELENVVLIGSDSLYGQRSDCMHSNLVTFKMNQCQVVNPNLARPFDPLLQYLSRCRNLEKVTMQLCNLELCTPTYFARLSLLPKLRALDLSKNTVTVPIIQELANGVDRRDTTPLQELDLSENPSVGNGACAAIGNSRKMLACLVEVTMKSCGVTDTGVEMLVQGILRFQPWRRRSIVRDSAESLVSCKSTLQVLDLSDSAVRDAGAVCLASLLSSATAGVQVSLKKLVLCRCCIKDTGAAALATALRDNQTLEELDLGKNEMTEFTILTFDAALKVNRHLKVLKVQGSYNLQATASLERCVAAFYETLTDNHILQRLNLRASQCRKAKIFQCFYPLSLLLTLNRAGRGRILGGECPVQEQSELLWLFHKCDASSLYLLLQSMPVLLDNVDRNKLAQCAGLGNKCAK